MARKVFQGFAHVLCQKFIEVPSNNDLINLIILGSGIIELDVLNSKARCNRFPIEPLPYSAVARAWLLEQMRKHQIPDIELVSALLTIEFDARLTAQAPLPAGMFDLNCKSSVHAPDRSYSASIATSKRWGLGTV
jgi:hypothetical protein